jgi:hypothetical protein
MAPPTLAKKENGAGKTVQVMLYLDPESRAALREAGQGMGGVFVRKAIAGFLAHLETSPAPPMVKGETSVFSMKIPADLQAQAAVYVGTEKSGKPYSTLSGLARTAIHHCKGRK